MNSQSFDSPKNKNAKKGHNSSELDDSPFCQKNYKINKNEEFSASAFLFKEEVGEKGINMNDIEVSQFTVADE